jgi:nicotinamidase-related amidase
LGKLVLLTDCISPVAGFEAQYDAFLRDMTARGLQTATSVDALAELSANS